LLWATYTLETDWFLSFRPAIICTEPWIWCSYLPHQNYILRTKILTAVIDDKHSYYSVVNYSSNAEAQ
jgi:hypothetical protein